MACACATCQMMARFDAIDAQLAGLTALVANLITQGHKMAADLTQIQSAVAKTTDVEQSAIVLLQSLSAQIASLKNDPAAIQALADQLNAKAGDLADAVTANTPSAP